MTIAQQLITIAICIACTMATRFLPFIIFRNSQDKPTPKFIVYLGNVLPAALFGMLAVYCLKDVDIFSGTHGIPELIGVATVVGVHLWKRKMMLSIVAGTVVYMLLVQFVF